MLATAVLLHQTARGVPPSPATAAIRVSSAVTTVSSSMRRSSSSSCSSCGSGDHDSAEATESALKRGGGEWRGGGIPDRRQVGERSRGAPPPFHVYAQPLSLATDELVHGRPQSGVKEHSQLRPCPFFALVRTIQCPSAREPLRDSCTEVGPAPAETSQCAHHHLTLSSVRPARSADAPVLSRPSERIRPQPFDSSSISAPSCKHCTKSTGKEGVG
jgi:hypothetical protein